MTKRQTNLSLDADVVEHLRGVPNRTHHVEELVRIAARVDLDTLRGLADLVTRLDEVDDPAAYLGGLADGAARRWQAAYRTLRMAGWQPAELSAACEALNGYAALLLVSDDLLSSAGAVELELRDADRLSQVALRRGVSEERWHALCDDLDAEGARALVDFAREFWRGNGAVARVLS